jgi:predicted HTH transcriptional regulator
MIDEERIIALSIGIAEMAASHKNDTISNELNRVSAQIEKYGIGFARIMTDADKALIRYYHQHKPR